jgi:hypothetical protein
MRHAESSQELPAPRVVSNVIRSSYSPRPEL